MTNRIEFGSERAKQIATESKTKRAGETVTCIYDDGGSETRHYDIDGNVTMVTVRLVDEFAPETVQSD